MAQLRCHLDPVKKIGHLVLTNSVVIQEMDGELESIAMVGEVSLSDVVTFH